MKSIMFKEALKKIDNPQILINMVSLRVRQLGQGFRPLILATPKMSLMEVALKEISEGKLSYQPLTSEDDDDEEIHVSGGDTLNS